ncbi:bifunctional hydroxymethylpyrimidine kinase/phosphomethylpyrimidine kinase [Paenibacillus mendelii]|uniref:Hydroxymethylpyrimidine/phosphomethylpyrimidine kinase n=1 Tax=Paenibacillus mendelii TaxID=206163 RepID=A0ABV6J8Z0_9BACL|nr:bifunctional hydroxymethylpyrimidine kinase/phosphomethylpyrimidine kinase [Paenibacillus mendelii]MCQ6559686.1 bifunctional hydroxymethylpyrimidine kinase/phosphomethylpyrimidine kinase [Paenibacillus mendelii]
MSGGHPDGRAIAGGRQQRLRSDPHPRVLTIAGSDSGGGAGIQADLKTCQELGVFGMTALTAVTAQNSLGVQAIFPLSVEAVETQLISVLDDMGADVVKTGMLLESAIIRIVAKTLEDRGIAQLVVDPVLYAKDGSALFRREAIESLKSELLPIASIVTPNIPEACELLELPADTIRTTADMIDAARSLLLLGPQYVLLKGGHLPGESSGSSGSSDAIDVLVGSPASGLHEHLLLRSPRIITRHTHGTGCTLASAIAAFLAQGHTVPAAAGKAKRFVTAAIAEAVPHGRGIGSLWHAAQRQMIE